MNVMQSGNSLHVSYISAVWERQRNVSWLKQKYNRHFTQDCYSVNPNTCRRSSILWVTSSFCRCVNDVFVSLGGYVALMGNCSSSFLSYSKITSSQEMIEYEEGKSTSKGNLWIKRVAKAIEPTVSGFWQVLKCILLSITNKMQSYTIFFTAVNAVHFSCGFSAHHQEFKTIHSIPRTVPLSCLWSTYRDILLSPVWQGMKKWKKWSKMDSRTT
jgi:hypothetical protein